MDAYGIDMIVAEGVYNPPDLLTADLIGDLVASRPFYPPGTMDLLKELVNDGLELEVLQCRYLCKDGCLRTLLDIINRNVPIDNDSLEERITLFKEFCDLEQIHGTQKALREIVAGRLYPGEGPTGPDHTAGEPVAGPSAAAGDSVNPKPALEQEGGFSHSPKSVEHQLDVEIRDLHPVLLFARKVGSSARLASSIKYVMDTHHHTFSRGSPLRGPNSLAGRGGQWPEPMRSGPLSNVEFLADGGHLRTPEG